MSYSSIWNTLNEIQGKKLEVGRYFAAPRFIGRSNWNDYNLDEEVKKAMEDIYNPGTKSLLVTTKELPYATKPNNIAQKARASLYSDDFGVTAIPFGSKRYMYVIPKENIYEQIQIDDKIYPGLFEYLTDLEKKFWVAIKELIDNYNSVRQLTLIKYYTIRLVQTQKQLNQPITTEDAEKIARNKVYAFIQAKYTVSQLSGILSSATLKNTIIEKYNPGLAPDFGSIHKDLKILATMWFTTPSIKPIERDYKKHIAEEEYNRLVFEREMLKNITTNDAKIVINEIEKELQEPEMVAYIKIGFAKERFDFRFWFSEIEMNDPQTNEKELLLKRKDLEQQLKQKKIDQARLEREMLVEITSRRQATEEMKNALIATHQQSIDRFSSLISEELSKILETLVKPEEIGQGEEKIKRSKVTNRTLTTIKNFCAQLKRKNTEFELNSIDKFVDEILDYAYECAVTTQNPEYLETTEKAFVSFIGKTISSIETDTRRYQEGDRDGVIITDYSKVFRLFEKQFARKDDDKETPSFKDPDTVR